MPNPLPAQLALTNIADGSPRLAAPLRNNYAAIQAAVNEFVVAFGVTAKGDLVVATASGQVQVVSVGANGQVLLADSTQPAGVRWATVAAGPTTYRKTTAKTVNGTVAATDLFNGELSLAANDLGTNKVVRITAQGDWKQNSGSNVGEPVLQFQLGGTTVLQTSPGSLSVLNLPARQAWWVEILIAELGTTNSQSVLMKGSFGAAQAQSVAAVGFATGEGVSGPGSVSQPSWMDFRGWNTAAKDGTGALTLALNVINANASANYETKLYNALVEVI